MTQSKKNSGRITIKRRRNKIRKPKGTKNNSSQNS